MSLKKYAITLEYASFFRVRSYNFFVNVVLKNSQKGLFFLTCSRLITPGDDFYKSELNRKQTCF